MRTTLAGIALASLLAGCAHVPEKSARAPAPNDNLNAVAWTQTAIEHDLIYREVYRVAGEKLSAALNDPDWDALPKRDRKQPLPPKLKPAVIVDIDETVLDNSPYQARLVANGKEYDEFTWSEWCREKRARPLPGALEFAQDAAKRGVTVIYLSNRAQDLNAATLENLRADGFPVEGDRVFLGLGTIVDGCEQVGTEKGCRRA
jgi:acid phosphatase